MSTMAAPSRRTGVPSPMIGMALFVFAEVMFFCGLISAFIVLRGQIEVWPPLDQPRLPVASTFINTLLLVGSGWTMWKAHEAFEAGTSRFARLIGATFVLGTLFVAIQGYEWVGLIGYGLTSSSSVYGALFYFIVGCHGAHVLAGLVWVGIVAWRAAQGRYAPADPANLSALRMFWLFIVGVWPPIYYLVYLW